MSEQAGLQLLAHVDLGVASESSRTFTGAPAQLTIGSVDFGGWQVHLVAASPAEFPASDVYLVKANYDVGLVTDAPAPIWVEAGFEFDDEDVSIADALPRSVRERVGACRYALTDHLAFDMTDDAIQDSLLPGHLLHRNIPMPALDPVIEVFGIGGSRIRWRHVAAAGTPGPVGSQVRWLALLVPTGCRELRARAHARYASTPHRLKGMRPGATPDTFTVRLPAQPGWPARSLDGPVSAGGQDVRGLGDESDLSAAAQAALTVRMGFVVDVVGYSQRTEPGQYAVQSRLTALIRDVMAELGISFDENYAQGTGDGMNVFLPAGADISRALPALLETTAARLSRDNQEHADRIRLRMATDLGPVRPASAGFSGQTIISFGRLVDSAPIRAAIADQPDTDLAALVSDWLYESVIKQGYAGVDPAQFTRVRAVVKSFQADAWLWTGPRRGASPGPVP